MHWHDILNLFFKLNRVDDFSNLTTERLYDLLIKHSLEYTHLLIEGASSQKRAYFEYKLSFLQSEIIKRY